MAIVGKHARIMLPTGDSVAFTSEATTVDATGFIYTITDSTLRMWDPQEPPVVTGAGGVVPANDYRVVYAGGQIVFKKTREPGDTITVSGKAFEGTPTRIGQSKSWDISFDVDTEETTVQGDDWKSFEAISKGGSVSMERFFIDMFFIEALSRPLYLLLYAEAAPSTAPRVECIAHMTSDSIQLVVQGLVNENVEFQITGEPNVVLPS